jgi:DNA repair protein RadA/Sms
MSKVKKQYVCASCGCITIKWFGCCPECKEWNSLVESQTSPHNHKKGGSASLVDLTTLDAIDSQSQERMYSGIREWDRVSGGGIIPGAFMILTGDPGIGKSTLMLHIAHELSKKYKLLYFSSEESLEQVKVRAERLNCADTKILFSDQANLDEIIATTLHHKPQLIIIDSIQNCYTSEMHTIPGSIGQLKEAAFRLMRLAKENRIAVLLSGHITKDGAMAGPKTLEHMVDAAFYLQGEDRWQTRLLRSIKNRFGTVNELGFFEMHEHGLREIPNINQQLLQETSHSPGSALTSSLEGTRPLLIELQTLTIQSKFGIPQRVISGADHTQVVLLAAILEKHLQIKLSAHDIFVKISGGFKLKESSADLAIALGLLSSFFQQPLPQKTLILGEINLTGHIKPINYVNMHIAEAEKFGIEQLFVAKNQKIEKSDCTVRRFQNVYELLKLFE